MKIGKEYKLENILDNTREVLNSVYVYQNGQSWAVATNGKALAKVPVTLEAGELEKGNSVLGSDFKFQRQNPAVKKQDHVFHFLQPLNSEYPTIENVFPAKENIKIEIGINAKMLKDLADALGSGDCVKLSITDEKTAIIVKALTSDAIGLLMPSRI